MVIYRCNHCKREYDSPDYFISISGADHTLRIVNNLDGAALIKLEFHNEVNFCSKKCFIDFFFKEEPNPTS